MKLSNVIRDFKGITKTYELQRTIEIMVKDKTYRLEVLRCLSKSNSPWSTEIFSYSPKQRAWKEMEGFTWVSEKSEEAAIRAALSFLNSN